VSNEHFEVVIVGSGFGGSVMAYRLAEAGLRVCLLERGKPYPPNSFARAPHKMRANFWDPSDGLYGLFNVWSFKGAGSLVSSGLGGGSLIYANIIIRKDEKWFVKEDRQHGSYESWPVTRAELDPHYDRVDRMMNVQKYPLAFTPYDQTKKTLAMREAAEKLKLNWIPLNLAVSFRPKPVLDPDHPDDQGNPPLVGAPIKEDFPNLHQMSRDTCRLCGECDIGCNYGSKNTLDYTYLSAAAALKPQPAEIRTLCEVKSFSPSPSGKGYTVVYLKHDPDRWEGQPADTSDPALFPPQTITCDRLILSAGTFGTPYLLLKNRQAFANLSSKLGSRFCVNGDLLSFIAKAKETRNGSMVPRVLDPSFGPVITSAIRLGDTLDGQGDVGRGFYVEDGGNPYLLSWVAELTGFAGLLRRSLHFAKMFLKYRLGLSHQTNLDDDIAALIGDCTVSKSSMPVLTVGRDLPTGHLKLNGKYLDCDWSPKQSSEYYARVIRVVSSIAQALNAEFVDNPSYQYLHQVVTAHPLGGCPMANSKEEGVVDALGEVFDYPGLYVADGSMMPGPVGPNPSMTIAALSDRLADHIIAQHKGANT
jgi:cholesterol oxidase